MALSLFSLKKTTSPKVTSFVDPTKFGGVASNANKQTLKSEVAQKSISNKQLKELSYIRRSLDVLISIEKRHFEFLGDAIKKFVLNEDKNQLREEEALQESGPKKDKNEKNPILKEGKQRLEGFGNFLQGLIKIFIAYKILEWAGNPQNIKKIQDFVNLFTGIFKFLNAIVGFGIDKLFSGISKLVDGEGVTRVFGFLEAAVGFFTLKWLLNPTKIISDIKMIGNLFTKVIPNAINTVINFFTNLIPKAAADSATEALGQAANQLPGEAADAARTGSAAAEGATTAASAARTGSAAAGAATTAAGAAATAAKGGAKVTGKSILKALPVIGAISSGIFAADRATKGDWTGAGMEVASGVASLLPGWGTVASLGIDAALIGRDIAKDQGIPMLAKGGIVTKPTQAIVGEAGPEAILPLDKLGSFGIDQFAGEVNKQIPKFIKLLTLPFKIVGAGIVALISSSISKIPGLGPILMPLISNVASMFGIPPGLVKGMSNFASTAMKTVGQGLSNVTEIFGGEDPKISKTNADEFKPSGDTSVRGLLGDILGALISKNGSSNTQPTTTPTPTPSGTPPATPETSTGTPKVSPIFNTPTGTPQSTPGTPKISPIFNTPTGTPQSTPGTPKISPIFNTPSAPLQTGAVPGTGTGDKVPALLEPGEYVLNKNAVRGMGGPGLLDKVNYGLYSRFQSGGSVLSKLGDNSKLASAPRGMCVTGVLETMAKNGVPNPQGTSNDPNNPRGLAAQLIKDYGWGSISGLGENINLKSAYGNVGANAMSFSQWKDAVKSNKIPSGSIIFTTRNSDWTGNQSSGHDAAIAKEGGKKLWSGHWQAQADGVGAVYGTSSNKIIALTPGGQQIPYDGSKMSDTGSKSSDSETSTSTAPDWSAITKHLGDLFKILNPSSESESVTPPAPKLPPVSGTPPRSSQSLQAAQQENIRTEAQRRSATKSGGAVVPINIPGKTVTESTTQPMVQPLGRTTPPVTQTVYPIAP